MPKPVATDPDPVVTKSLSVPLLVSTLILTFSLVWAIYDEVYVMRPWKAFQADFIQLYSSYLGTMKPKQAEAEALIKDSPEYQALQQEMEAAEQQASQRMAEIGKVVREGVTPRLLAARSAFQVLKSEIDALTYQIEVAGSESAKQGYQEEIDQIKARVVEVNLAKADGSGEIETVQVNFDQLQAEYLGLQDRRVALQAESAEAGAPAGKIRAEREALLTDRLAGLTEQQVDGLISKMDGFTVDIKQIHLNDIDWVDRCESCHLGIREPVNIKAGDVAGRAEFISHPSRDLLQIHNPDEFGCSTCHNGNGRATSSVVKGHGRHKFWLWPMWQKENMQAGCQQCHAKEVITEQADVLNKGRTLFLNKGCWGCHRFEGFDRESDELATVRQQLGIIADQRDRNLKERREAIAAGDVAEDIKDGDALYARAEVLHLRNAKLDAEYDALTVEEQSLILETRKFGPNLKEIKVKLRKEWVPVWLTNPHDFRPGTKMPEFRLQDDEVQKISAYLWQNAIDADLTSHPPGSPERGKELFGTRGCLGCHSMGEGDERQGGTFAANLTRVGEKTNYNFLVRWINDPSEVTPDPEGLSAAHQIPIMPSLRLSIDEVRDVASYLINQKTDAAYAPAAYMDDPAMGEEGAALIRHYGCAGCHEISGLEEEGRIGTELTLEGSKPVERLDFALLTHEAEGEGWYNHKGFFERKLKNPAIYDEGKVRQHLERLRMPNFHLADDEITAITTFLLGAVDTTLPQHYRYEPEDDRRFVQEGWWIVRRYNCVGCHQISPSGRTSLMGVPLYEDPDWQEQLPPQLYTQGARVQPDWLMRFLENPSLHETDIHKNGIRTYLEARMPTFHFSERQVQKLSQFFMARSAQSMTYIPPEMAPLTAEETAMARSLFQSRAAPCLKCHMTGNAVRDRSATAPNFMTASSRLKPDWTYRWLLEPAKIAPGTAMPSELFRKEGDRWVFSGPLPATFADYEGDHADLLVRYMFQLTPSELNRLVSAGVQ